MLSAISDSHCQCAYCRIHLFSSQCADLRSVHCGVSTPYCSLSVRNSNKCPTVALLPPGERRKHDKTQPGLARHHAFIQIVGRLINPLIFGFPCCFLVSLYISVRLLTCFIVAFVILQYIFWPQSTRTSSGTQACFFFGRERDWLFLDCHL